MAVLNITEAELTKLIDQVKNDEIEIAHAWDLLGEKGDAYAFLAGAIVSDDTASMSGIARIFYEMVRSQWQNTGAGAGVWGGEVFFGVGKEHLINYLNLLRSKPVAGGYTLPTTIEIEVSYKAALNEYGLLPDTAIDAHFSVVDYFVGNGGGELPKDFSWAEIMNLANLAMGGPSWGEGRVEYNSEVFINDIDPIEAVITLGRTVLDTFGAAAAAIPSLAPIYWVLQLVDGVIDFTMEDFAKQNAVQVLYKRIDNSLTGDQIGTLLQTGANDDRLAFSELIDRLGQIFSDAIPSSKDNSSQLFNNVKTISDIYKAGGWSLSIKTMDDNAASLAAGDGADALAYRYALVNLNPFVVTGFDYSSHNNNNELDLYNPETGEGTLTDKYLEDRAKMLAWKQRYDIDDKSYTSEWNSWSVIGDWDFIDHSTQIEGQPLKLSIDGVYLASTDNYQIAFGSASSDTLTGEGLKDHLYGGDDNDTLEGKGGNDYLEGGQGDDTYKYTTGDGLDTIFDVDGTGSIVFDTTTINGGDKYCVPRILFSILRQKGVWTIKASLFSFISLVLFNTATIASPESGCVDNQRYYSLAFSPDSKHLAAASEGKRGCFELWEISSRKRKTFLSINGRIHSLIYSKDGGLLYLGENGGQIVIWDTAKGKIVDYMRGIAQLLTLDISDDGNYLAVGGVSSTAKLLDLRTKAEVLKLDKHGIVDSIDISPSGKYIALAQTYGVDLWDINKGIIIHSFKVDGQNAISVRFTPDEKRLAAAFSCMPDGCSNVRVFNLNNYTHINSPVGTSQRLLITPDNKYIVSGNTNGNVVLIDLSDLSISRVFANAGGPVISLAVSQDGNYIAAGTWNGIVKVWELSSGKLVINLKEQIDQ